jgi:hypothetical protein
LGGTFHLDATMQTITSLFVNRSQRDMFNVLAVLLLLQIAAAVALVVPWDLRAPEREPVRLLTAMQDATVRELQIEDMQGNVIHLIREDDGEWRFNDFDGYPASNILADQLIEDMVELDDARPVTQTAGSHDRLRVGEENFERRLTVTLATDEEVVAYVGTAPLPRATHVRAADQQAVYISTDLKHREVSTQITRWLDTVYYSEGQNDIREFNLTNPNGTFSFKRGEDDQWMMEGLAEGEIFNPNNLISLVTTVSTISLTRPLGKQELPEYGMLNPQAVATFRVQDDDEDEMVSIVIGANTERANRVVVKSTESEWFVEANRFTVDRLIERTRDEFLVKQPVPEPAAEPVQEEVPAPVEEPEAAPTESE